MKNIEIDDSFTQKTIQVEAGDTITLRLEESPTTGYAWEAAEINVNEIELTGHSYQLHEGAGMGGGGIKTFKLKVLAKAAGKLTFENRQRWEGDVYQSFTLNYE